MNNDNDLNLHSMTKLSGWLRYYSIIKNDLWKKNEKVDFLKFDQRVDTIKRDR